MTPPTLIVSARTSHPSKSLVCPLVCRACDPATVTCDVCLQPLIEHEAQDYATPLVIDKHGSKTIDLRVQELCAARLRREVG